MKVPSQTPEERIKQLLGEQAKRQRDLEDKKAELEKQRKELEDLEAKTKKDSENATKTIQEQIEELAVEEREAFEAIERQRRAENLEAAVRQEDNNPAVQDIMQGNAGFYQVTNYNVIGTLDTMAQAATQRPLTENERQFLDAVQYHAERLQRDDYYKDKQGAKYLSMELAKIDFINKMAKERDYT